MRRRGVTAVVLLCVFALQACHRAVPVQEPAPDQDIRAIVLRTGQRIDLPDQSTAAVEGDSVVVRDSGTDAAIQTYAFDDIEHVIVREFALDRTVGVAALLATLVVVVIVFLEAIQPDFSDTGGGCYLCYSAQ